MRSRSALIAVGSRGGSWGACAQADEARARIMSAGSIRLTVRLPTGDGSWFYWQMPPTQLPDAQSQLLRQVWPAWHLAAHEPPQSTSPSSPFLTPSPQYGTQVPASLQR